MGGGKRLPRYRMVTTLLTVYALVMAYMGRERFLNPSTRLTYILTIAGEAAVLVALYFFLRRRDRQRNR